MSACLVCSYCGKPVSEAGLSERCEKSPSGCHVAFTGGNVSVTLTDQPPDEPEHDASGEQYARVTPEADPRGPSPMRGAYAAWLLKEDARRRVPDFLLPRGDEIASREYFEQFIEPRETQIEEAEEDARASREADERRYGAEDRPEEGDPPVGVEEGHDLDLAEVFGLDKEEGGS